MSEMEKDTYEVEDDVLELIDEEGNSEKFYMMAKIEYKGAEYGVFELAEPQSEEEEGATYIFSMEEDGDDVIFNEVEDDETGDAVFNMYLEKLEAYDEEN